MKTEIKIYYNDTDCGGVVYYANYLKFFEQGRTEYLNAVGLSPKERMSQGILFAVVTADIAYHHPARYGDTLVIDTFVTKISGASVSFGYKVFNKESNQLLTEGNTKVVLVDTNMKVRKLEPWFSEKLGGQA